MLGLNLVAEHFACEIDPTSGRKSPSLKTACGKIALSRCVSVLSGKDVFYTCGPHTPAVGYHVSRARWSR